MQMFGNMFQAEPLTPEQEARLPAAQALVLQVMPDGFYAELMRKTMGSVLDPILSMIAGPEGADLVLAKRLAVDPDTFEGIDEAVKMEIVTILDPGYTERGKVMTEAFTTAMSGAFAQIEPPMRDGLARAYAVRFDEQQLADIAAFFATDTGALYANESMALFADPQVMSASMQAMPAMMGSFTNMETLITEAMNSLPAERGYNDLSDADRARLGELLGLSGDDLREAIIAPKKPDETMEAETSGES